MNVTKDNNQGDKQFTKVGKNSGSKGSGGIQSIHRAIRLIKVVADGDENGMRLTDIYSVLDLKPTTAFRLLASLAEEGMLAHDNLTKRYTLGLELARIGTRAKKISIIENWYLALENICRQSEDTVFLFEATGTLCQCLKRMEGPYPVRALAVNEGDCIPQCLYEAREDTGWKILKEDFEKMLDEYYELREWDKNGKPSVEVIKRLEIQDK